jgi:hypothetical protein
MTPPLPPALRVLLLAALLCLTTGCALALAADTTRTEYVAAVEPICKTNTQANERILAGVRNEVRADKLRPAAGKFAKAAAALKQTLVELRAVPQPKADKPRLTKWLGYVKGEVGLFEATSRKLKAGDKAGAERMSVKLTHEANLANDQVLAFEFSYCRAEPSRFM